jgi:hypothetical protein
MIKSPHLNDSGYLFTSNAENTAYFLSEDGRIRSNTASIDGCLIPISRVESNLNKYARRIYKDTSFFNLMSRLGLRSK